MLIHCNDIVRSRLHNFDCDCIPTCIHVNMCQRNTLGHMHAPLGLAYFIANYTLWCHSSPNAQTFSPNVQQRFVPEIAKQAPTAMGILECWPRLFELYGAVSETFISLTNGRHDRRPSSIISLHSNLLANLSRCLSVCMYACIFSTRYP